jgi:hypothetical protein
MVGRQESEIDEASEGWSDSRTIEALETDASTAYRVRKPAVQARELDRFALCELGPSLPSRMTDKRDC